MTMREEHRTSRSAPRTWRILATVALMLSGCGMGWLVACSTPDSDARVDPVGPTGPDRASFDYVAPVLARRCGSIDCHGSRFRNLRIYGFGGTRLDPTHRPDLPEFVTPAEINATYESVIGLEPEIIRAVASAGGAGAERLSLVRKGRGDEDHKGDRRITPGDDSDICILSWLAGNVRKDECNKAGCLIDAGFPDATKIGSCR